MRIASTDPVQTGNLSNKNNGYLVVPGMYKVQVLLINNGAVDTLSKKTSFEVKGLSNQTLLAKNPKELMNFRKELSGFNLSLNAAMQKLEEISETNKTIGTAILTQPNVPLDLAKKQTSLVEKLEKCKLLVYGDDIRRSKEFEVLPGISERFGLISYMVWENTTGVTSNHQKQFALIKEEFIAFETILNEADKETESILNTFEQLQIPYIKK
ncbi:MAG: hypothetical protein LW688_13910 [Cryomorphaceae bacterium]|nr:hypothetical protein [Cryomorphaceae bacterium]